MSAAIPKDVCAVTMIAQDLRDAYQHVGYAREIVAKDGDVIEQLEPHFVQAGKLLDDLKTLFGQGLQ